MVTKVVIVHSLAHAKAALAAARDSKRPVTLASAPGAAGTLGPRWFQAVVELAARAVPEVRFHSMIDCGDRPGDALAALRCGLPAVRFTGTRKSADKLAAIAAQLGAELVTGRLTALDLRDQDEPFQATRDWLER